MSETILHVENLSKRYAKGGPPNASLSYDVLSGVKNMLRNRGQENDDDYFYALEDISFTLARGDVLGIIGRNGAGKSTLLKILSEITPPSMGQVRYQGTVTSILDVGTGFHPDLSGRQNVFLGGAIAGMSRKDIRKHFDEIVAFSGIEEFIDMPVKHYSSGMFLRLAFSVAFHTPMDILLLDEVLSVGDVDFRSRSTQKIKDVARSGATVIMVSHELAAIRKLCNKCMLLEKGKLVAFGDTTQIVDEYMETFIREVTRKFDGGAEASHYAAEVGDSRVAFTGLDIHAQGKAAGASIYMSDPIELTIRYEKKTDEDDLFVVVYLHNYDGIVLGDSFVFREDYDWVKHPAGHYELKGLIPGNLLYQGAFIVELVFGSESQVYLELPYVQRFQVDLNPWEAARTWNKGDQEFPLRPHFKWEMKRVGV